MNVISVRVTVGLENPIRDIVKSNIGRTISRLNTCFGTVLFDAPQIPAGMHPFCRIPPDSTGICWIPVPFHWNPAE